jgi:hypothetical protein
MKFITNIIFCISFSFSFGKNNPNYTSYFQDEIIEINNFLEKSASLFDRSSKKYNHNKKQMIAIVYPELLRYNYLKDFFETSSLELIYVNYGSKAADFSIGHFQMKPSFIEKIEKYIGKNEILHKKYKHLIIKHTFTPKHKRTLRIKRLQNTSWQLAYLNAFIDVCYLKFPLLKNEPLKKQIHFLAASYNIGINFTFKTIKQRSNFKIFPFGSKYNGDQFCYADIACDYFNSKN